MYYDLGNCMEVEMKIFKRILKITIVAFMMIVILVEYRPQAINNFRVVDGEPVKVGVLLYKFDDAYISLVRQNLEEIEKNNEGKVKFTFFDGKGDQNIQNKTMNTLLEKKEVDLLLLNLVDTRSTQEAINKIKEKNIPVVLFNREPVKVDAIKSYGKAYFVGTNINEAGILQGQILIDIWNANKDILDKNKDDIMQYIMLKGERDNLDALARTKYSVLTINEAGIKTQELALRVCEWNEDVARNMTKELFLQFGNKIEVIISNNDSMAIGAIKTLQEYGYNNGDITKTIPVVGVDAIPEAQELIKKGFMAGSVLQNAKAMADAIYSVGMNLVYNKNPLEGTKYKFDETGVSIRIPYELYIASSS